MKTNIAAILYQQVLDRISAAVFVVGFGRHLIFTNAAGDDLLSAGDKISAASGVLQGAGHASALNNAMDRALTGDAALGLAGIGVSLISTDGNIAAAYVLPLLGKDIHGVSGPGHCAVFIGGCAQQQPLAVDMLRSMFDFTTAEARIAMMIAKGKGPQNISEGLGIKVNTVRTHLKHIFAKSDTADQTALAGQINSLLPPVR